MTLGVDDELLSARVLEVWAEVLADFGDFERAARIEEIANKRYAELGVDRETRLDLENRKRAEPEEPDELLEAVAAGELDAADALERLNR